MMMERVTKHLGDVVVRLTHGNLHGVPCVHEVQLWTDGRRNSRWYVEGSFLAGLPPQRRDAARKLSHHGGEAFEHGVMQLAQHLLPQ